MNDEYRYQEHPTDWDHPCTILVIEDDCGVVEAMVTLLSDEGYHVVTAGNGTEALEYLTSHGHKTPCVILLDIMMPVMDGYAFRNEQRRHRALSEIPVVVLTAGGRSHRIDELHVAGFLKKPIDIDALLGFLGKYC